MMQARFFISIGLILISAALGYMARQRGWLSEDRAKPLMTIVTVFGYPIVGFLAIWGAPLRGSDIWLPLLGGAQATVMAMLALFIGRFLFHDRVERGLVGISCGIGNHGITMAGFAVYLLFGADGLGLNTLYAIYTFFALVFLSYTIAQRFAPDVPHLSIPKMLVTNILHWRASGLYACSAALILTAAGVPKPPQVYSWHLLDGCIYTLIVTAYFSIGLRLHLPHINKVWRAVFFVMTVRHLGGLIIGLALAGLTQLSPWPLQALSLKVFLLQASVPMGVMAIAVANMFHLKPGEASAIFVVTSLAYLIIGMPLVMLIFGS